MEQKSRNAGSLRRRCGVGDYGPMRHPEKERKRKMNARIVTDNCGKTAALEWTDENGEEDFLLSKRGIAIKLAELIVLGYTVTTVSGVA